MAREGEREKEMIGRECEWLLQHKRNQLLVDNRHQSLIAAALTNGDNSSNLAVIYLKRTKTSGCDSNSNAMSAPMTN